MKNTSLKNLCFCALVVILLTASCRRNSAGPDSSYHATETALWQSAQNSVQTTMTQSVILTAQSWTPTATPLMHPTYTPSPIPMSPIPTATLPSIAPMTPLPLKNIKLSNDVYYLGNELTINLSDYHFDKPLEIDSNRYKSFVFYLGSWSADGKHLALKAEFQPIKNQMPKRTDLGICNSSADQGKSKCIRIYTNIYNHSSVTQGNYAEIKNISWSPDNNYLLVTVKGINTEQYIITSPCLVEVDTSSVDCHWTNIFGGLAGNSAYKVVAGAHAISWSPQDENKLAIPLKTNWIPLSEGVESGSNPYAPVTPWDIPTDSLKQGLYIVDINPLLMNTYPPADDRILTLLWEAPQNTAIDPDQLPVWTSDGKQITFVYADPWFDVARNPIYPYTPIANYVVGMIGDDGKNFQKLFDSREMYLSGVVLPSGSNLPAIFIHRWVYQDRLMLFTAQVYLSAEHKYEQSLFLFDTKTGQFFQVTNWNELR